MLSFDNVKNNQQWQRSSTPPRQILGTTFADDGTMWTSQAVSSNIQITPPQPRLTHHRSHSSLYHSAQQMFSPPSDATSGDAGLGGPDDANYLMAPGARILPRIMPPSPPPSIPSRSRTPFRIAKRGQQGSVSGVSSSAASPFAPRSQAGSPMRQRSHSRQRTPSRHMNHQSLTNIPNFSHDDAPPLPSQARAIQHQQEERLRRAVSMTDLSKRSGSQSPIRQPQAPPMPPMPTASMIATALENHNRARSMSVSPQRHASIASQGNMWPSMSPSRGRNHSRSSSMSVPTARMMGLGLDSDIPPVPPIPQLPTTVPTTSGTTDVMLGSHLLMGNANPYLAALNDGLLGAKPMGNRSTESNTHGSGAGGESQLPNTIDPSNLFLNDDLFGDTNFLNNDDIFGSVMGGDTSQSVSASLPVTTVSAAAPNNTVTAPAADSGLNGLAFDPLFDFENPMGNSVFDNNFFSLLEPFNTQMADQAIQSTEDVTQATTEALHAVSNNNIGNAYSTFDDLSSLVGMNGNSENIMAPTNATTTSLDMFGPAGFAYESVPGQAVDYFPYLSDQLSMADQNSIQPFDFQAQIQSSKPAQSSRQQFRQIQHQMNPHSQARMGHAPPPRYQQAISLSRYLTSAIPSPSIIPQPVRQTFGQKHIWFDVRNIRDWDDFSIGSITATLEVANMLGRSFDADHQLSSAPFTDPSPAVGTETSLAKVWNESVFWLANRALEMTDSSRTENATAVSYRQLEIPRSQAVNSPDFVLNRSQDGQRTFDGKTRARVVGAVKPYALWNTGMKKGQGGDKTKYLAGLAHLHYLMRENHTRYGFIITEVELVCVRAGGPTNNAAAVNISPNVQARYLDQAMHDNGTAWPLFGYLEVCDPIPLKASGKNGTNKSSSRMLPTDDLFAPNLSSPPPRQMTAPMALWYLGLLASDSRPAGQPYWEMNVGGPSACTRQTVHPERDDWIADLPVTISDRRTVKNSRVWVWPTDKPTSKEAKGTGRSRFALF